MPSVPEALVRGMRACLRWPAFLDPLKAVWLLAAMALLKWKPLRGYAPRIACEHGFVLAGAPTSSMLNRIVLYRGVFEPTLSELIVAQVRTGDACLDLGANAGYFALLLARRVGPAGRVLAVEASPATVAKLQANLDANGFEDRVAVVHAACSDRSGETAFYINRYNDMHCRLELPGPGDVARWWTPRHHWRRIVVPARSLTQILDEAGVAGSQVRFAKLDIEGAEHLVTPDLLACCTHPQLMVALELKPPHVREVLQPFEAAGFHAYDLCNDYRWLLNLHHRRPVAVDFAALSARGGMVDVLLCRQPLADVPPPVRAAAPDGRE